MITNKLAQMLSAQIASEVGAHQAYLGMSIYFRRASLDRWAQLFHKQAMEEAGHAMKNHQFLDRQRSGIRSPRNPFSYDSLQSTY
jgi:bacterioferritin B